VAWEEWAVWGAWAATTSTWVEARAAAERSPVGARHRRLRALKNRPVTGPAGIGPTHLGTLPRGVLPFVFLKCGAQG